MQKSVLNISSVTLLVLMSCSVSLAESPYWRTRPGGLASINYRLPPEPVTGTQKGYYNIDFSFKITKDPGNSLANYNIPASVKTNETTLGYYWANQFSFVNGRGTGVDGYTGLQTTGPIFKADPANRQDDRKNQYVKNTRIAIFSIWGALDGRSVGPKSYAAPFGHEGEGWSCKVEYPWREGVTYTIRLHELSDARKPNEPEWWRGSVIDTSTGKETIIGDILVPGQWGWLQSGSSMFTEYYSSTVSQAVGDADDGKPNPRVCQHMPKASIVVNPPKANLGTVNAVSLQVTNYGKCAGVSSWQTVSGRGLRSGQSVNESVQNSTGSIDKIR